MSAGSKTIFITSAKLGYLQAYIKLLMHTNAIGKAICHIYMANCLFYYISTHRETETSEFHYLSILSQIKAS